MRWNWQQADWPRFSWNPTLFAKAEERFTLGAGIFLGTAKHLHRDDHNQLAVIAMSEEALTTSAIEGEILDRASVQSSIRQQLGIADDLRRARPGERGIAELMVDLYRRFAEPLDEQTLLRWHTMVTSGRTDLRDVGRYRTSKEPMQVVSGRLDKPVVHFEAPPSSRVEREMKRFIAWFNRTAPRGPQPLAALVRAGAAHVYFESIHPFEDGNGRIGRAICEKVLAQSIGRPTLTALAATILAKRRAYYDALQAANKRCEITDWLAWFAATALEAQERTTAHVEFLIEKTKLLDRLRVSLNERQKKALLRMLSEGPRGFEGGMSAGKYVSIVRTSAATATRDLADLVEHDVLRRTGERKHSRYHLTITTRPIPMFELDPNGEVVTVEPTRRR